MNNFLISNKDVLNSSIGVIYEMHPYHKPENINDIVDGIEKTFTDRVTDKEKTHTLKLLRFDNEEEFYQFLKELLLGIKAFEQLNISRKLKELGVVDAKDERNQGYAFTDRYTVETDDKRYSDFVDLDACIRNIYSQILNLRELREDCFLCKYAKEYGSMEPGDERCNNCLCNQKIKCLHEPHPMSIKPKNQWTEEEKQQYGIE